MAGALTANAIDAQYDTSLHVHDEEVILATIAFLSPVEGANNCLLKAVVTYGIDGDDDELTFQWRRAAPAANIEDTALGDAVGDPYIIDVADTGGLATQIKIIAVDRGPGLSSGYALTCIGTDASTAIMQETYADAVLYD